MIPLRALFAALAIGCVSGDSTPDPASETNADPSADATPADGAAADGPVVRQLREVGPAGQVPVEFVVLLGADRYPSGRVGRVASDTTVIRFDPEVAGQTTVTGTDALTFRPTSGFRPGTTYVATVDSVGEGDAVVSSDGGGRWSRSFETPAFAYVRMALRSVDVARGRAEVELLFSAPVDPDQVRKLSRFTMGDQSLQVRAVRSGERPDAVRFELGGVALREPGELSLSLKKGVTYRDDASVVAASGAGTVSLQGGEPVRIDALQVKEGANGYYLDVVCNDPSGGDERWWWDPESYDGWWVSRRCALEEDALSAVHISPSVDLTLAEGPAGFRLFGDLPQGRYEVSIDAGATTVDGGILREAWTGAVRIPQRSPRLSLAAQGRYLPRSAWRELALSHINVDEVQLRVRHVRPENLVFWLTGDEAASTRTSELVLKRDIALSSPEDEQETTWVDVGALMPDAGAGVYEIELQEKDGSARDAARLLLTDIQLIAKRAAPAAGQPFSSAVNVWALDTHTGDALSGVDVRLVRASGANLARCRTDSQGGCRLVPPSSAVDPADAIGLIATLGDDLTYLKFADLELSPDAMVEGLAWHAGADESGTPRAAYQAAAWTERGVYRPGETVHMAAIVRADDHLAPPKGLPLVLRLLDPRGKEQRKSVVPSNDLGLVTWDLAIADFASTGGYRVTVDVADRKVGEVSFNVEEFVPERMKVEVEGPIDGVLPGDPVTVDVSARWLFGGSAEGSRAEISCRLEPATFTSDALPSYRFGPAWIGQRAPRAISLGASDARLDADGKAALSCASPGPGGLRVGSAQVVASVSVFEGESGRSTKSNTAVPVHAARHYVGLRSSAARASAGAELTIDGRMVDWTGKALPEMTDTADVRIYRLDEEYGWWWDEEDDSSRYERQLRRVRLEDRSVDIKGGRFSVPFSTKADAAGWIVSVQVGAARSEVHIEGEGRRYYWSGASQVDATPRPERPTPLVLSVPSEIHVGQEVQVDTVAPYAGRVLFTIETDEVIEHAWVDTAAGEVSWRFRLDSFVPNAYVTALLVKDPHLESQASYLPGRAWGVSNVRVIPDDYTTQLKLEIPGEVRPYSTFSIGLDAGPGAAGATALVAAVDEGILQLTRYKSPDPNAQLFAQRRLAVDSFETIGWTLVTKPGGPSSHTGGDADGGGGRVQMVKPVSLWSGPVTLDDNGRATVELDVPGYRGQLRVMAVVVDAERVGHADGALAVRDPIVIQGTIPRQLVAGDLAQLPVFVSNMSGKDRTVEVRIELEAIEGSSRGAAVGGPPGASVSLAGLDKGTVQLADGESGTVVFQVRADRGASAVRVRFVASSGDLKSKEEFDLPVLPATPEARGVVRTELLGGEVDLAKMLRGQGWMPGTDRTRFWVTTNPYAEALTHLTHLARYPYGCIEQTTSGTRPLLYLSSVVDGLDPDLGDVDDMVAKGIDRVMSMQTTSGGFSYWPGGNSASRWGTAYATLMLVEAKDAGHAVPETGLADALDYLDRQVSQRSSNVDSGVALSHYVLARSDKARAAEAEAALEQIAGRKWKSAWQKRRDAESKYLLQAALYLGGDHRHEATLRSPGATAAQLTRGGDWTFYSDLRRQGMMLSVHQDLFGIDPVADGLAGELSASLAGRSVSYSTQELGWAIAALGRRVQAAGVPESALALGGKPVQPLSKGETLGLAWQLTGASGADDLVLKHTAGERAWLITTTDGVRAADDLPTGGAGLKVTRTYRDANGQPLDLSHHTLGDRVFVDVVLENTGKSKVQNIALVDRVPAGWELDNPRLGGAGLPEWADKSGLWDVEHLNVRDDRVELFGELGGGKKGRVIFAVRAVTAGSFLIPEVRAEAMYDPGTWARETGEVIEIHGPWEQFLL